MWKEVAGVKGTRDEFGIPFGYDLPDVEPCELVRAVGGRGVRVRVQDEGSAE